MSKKINKKQAKKSFLFGWIGEKFQKGNEATRKNKKTKIEARRRNTRPRRVKS